MTISKRASSVNSCTREETDLECELTPSMLIVKPINRVSRATRRSFLFIFVLVGAILLACSTAFAQTNQDTTIVKVANIHIGGFMDPHNESLINSTLKSAGEQGASLYVIQLDSDGVAGANINAIAENLSRANFVTAIWIGPTSATYSKELASIVEAVDFVGAANGELTKSSGAEIIAPSLREFYAQLDGNKVERLDFTLDTGCSREEIEANIQRCKDEKLLEQENFKLSIAPRFEKLSPIANLGHSLIKPGFAIGILVFGLCLIAFEFFAASVGIAAIAGTLASLSGIYGLGYLPTNWFFVAMVVLGVGALIIDVQAGGVGLYSVVGTLMILIGSYFSVERTGSYGVSIFSAIIITIGALLFSVGATPSLIRTRFGTATIGREDFIGDEGIADGDIDPEGSVKLRGGSWKARTNHATPIKDGEKCKIVKIEGIVLEVEPLIGAAVDYREKSR